MSEYLLKDITELIVDCPHSTANDEGKGYPLVRTPNIGKGRLVYQGMHRVSEEVYNKRNQRAVPQEDDLIFAREATAGNVALIQKGEKVCLGQRTVLIRPNKSLVDPAYLTYLLLAPKQQYNLLGTANGATVAHVNLPTIRNLKLELPDLEVQHRIATILSRYDSLIENYRKQIKLLEEAAQRLYKEWFVDLRFPGYENSKMVDGLPEGWERKKLGEVCEVNKTSIAKNYAYNYVNYNDLGNVREGSIQEPVRYVYGQEPGRAKRVAKDGDVIWGMVRPNLKSYALVQNPKPQDVYSTGFAVLSSKAVPFSFLYCAVITDDFVGYLVNCTNGAAYPAVKAVHFENAVLLVPSRSLLDEFSKFAELLFRKCGKLSSQIRLLTEARDRLLPRLMGGEMDVKNNIRERK